MSLKLYKRGTVWHYRGTVAGRRLRGSTETSDEARARRITAETEAKAWSQKLDGPEETFTFANACEIYLNAGRSVRMVKHMADYWKDTLVRDIKTPAIHAAAMRLFPNAGGASKNRYVITPTQCIINYSAKQGYCAPLRVERFKTQKTEKTPVTLEWVQAFTQEAAPELAALCWFMFLTAARISEALFLQWQHIEGNTALVRMTKGGAPAFRRAHLPTVLLSALDRIRDTDSGFVFPYEYPGQAAHHWRYCIKRAGIPFRSFHACRHGFATSLLHSGLDPITVAKLGGWASPQHIYQTYGHAMQDKTLTDRLLGTDTGLTQPGLVQPEKVKQIEHLDAENTNQF